MKKAFYVVCLIASLALAVSLVMSEAQAKLKDKYQGNLAPRNMQLNVQRNEAAEAQLEHSRQQRMAGLDVEEAGAYTVSSYNIYATDYKATIEEDIVHIKGEANFEVMSKGLCRIPLIAASNVGLIEVSLNRGSSYIIEEGNRYYLLIDRPGRYELNIEFLMKVNRERERGPGQFTFEVLPAPVSEFEFTIPENDVEVFIEPSIKVETEQDDDKTVAWAIMPKTNRINVRWSKALPQAVIEPAKLEPKVYATVYTLAAAGEGFLRCQSFLNYSIQQSEISGVRVVLPSDVTILDVNAADLRDWKAASEGEAQYLDVYFKYGKKGHQRVDIVYERSIGEGSVVAQLPDIKVLGVERTKGFIGVASATNVELKVNALKGATSIDVKELPQSIWHLSQNPVLLAFKYLNDNYNIEIEVIRHEEIPVLIATIDLANYVSLNTDDGKRLTKALYHVRNNVKQFLRLRLPEDAQVWSASVSDKPVKPAKDKKGYVLIPLEKSQFVGEEMKQFPVEIVYIEKGPAMKTAGSRKISLPEADIPASEVYWSMYLPKEYAYYNFAGDLKRAQRYRTPVLEKVGRAVAPLSTARKSQYVQEQYEQEALDEVAQRGALPIKITVPQQGRMYRFSKLLVSENEPAMLKFTYISRSKSWLIKLGIFLVIALAVFYLINTVRKKRNV